ncbi:hypothetical protein BDB01DRAFT_786584 [Pilobolus umbonatus]|nr:hypothetical protein BDB01DRAFT_786584 [Pilobolus umbonatus]
MERSFPNTSNSNLSEMLSQEIEDLNKDTAEDRSVKEAIIVDKPDPNKINTEESEDDSDDGRYYVDDDIDSDEYEHDLAIRDPVLFRITESNRHIAVKDLTAEDSHTKSKGSRRPPELVFSEPPILISRDDCIEVSFYYGLSNEKKTGRCQRYMVMCGIGEESMNALRWGLGTILRSGDEIHISSVVPNDEPVESMDSDEKYNLWRQLDRNSKTMISRVRSIMDEMLLYNIKIVVYSLAGKTRETLLKQIHAIPNLTMVICGCRERGLLKG